MRKLLALVPLLRDFRRIVVSFWMLRVRGSVPIVFFDLDNTLADTWPTLAASSSREFARDLSSESRRLDLLQPLPGTVDLYNELKKMPVVIVVCTVRQDCFRQVTQLWLSKNVDPRFGLSKTGRLILVSTPYSKLALWTLLQMSRVKIFVIDDLSYNHENGDIRHYNFIKFVLSKFKIRVLAFSCIRQLNGVDRREAVKQRLEEVQSVLFGS
jgi:hypothetical protein